MKPIGQPSVKCKCGNSADLICLTHKTYICEKERSKHKCLLKDLKEFVGDMNKSLQDAQKDLNFWSTSFSPEIQSHVDSNKIILKEIQSSINASIDSIVGNYGDKISVFLEEKLLGEKKGFLAKLTELSKNHNYIEMEVLIAQKSKISESKNQHTKLFAERDGFFKIIQNFLAILSKQLETVSSFAAANSINYSENTEKMEEEFKKCVSNAIISENRYFNFPRGVNPGNSNLNFTRQFSMNYAETVVNTFVPKRTMMELNRDGSKKSSVRPLGRKNQADPMNESLIESQKSFALPADYDDPVNYTSRTENTKEDEYDNFDFDIDDKDFHFEDDEDLLYTQDKGGNIQNLFDASHLKFSKILDRALYDTNCAGFYDKNHRESVNGYIDKFKESVDLVLMEVKNNFNRL